MTEKTDDVASTEWITGAEAARLMGIDPSSLSRLRGKGAGPRYYQGPREYPRYKRADVLEHIEKSKRGGTA